MSMSLSHGFGKRDADAIAAIRILAADVVSKAKSGHPGAPLGCAPLAHVLFSRFFVTDPARPKWVARDRFVLSNGHACALLYTLLHLQGMGVTMDDLRSFRQWGSITPGHPEVGVTPGIEVTTGPLGQGIAAAVGLAAAQAHLAATTSAAHSGSMLFDNYTYVIVGDGCLQEGVAAEAASLAGHLGLGRLIVLYDDNKITIDGDTSLSFTEDVCARFQAYGWHTLHVDNGDGADAASLDSIAAAITAARNVHDRPSLIRVRTTIGYGSLAAGTHHVHGSPLSAPHLEALKSSMGYDPKASFVVLEDVYAFYRETVVARGVAKRGQWEADFAAFASACPDVAADMRRRMEGKLPSLKELIAKMPASLLDMAAPAAATRKLGETALTALVRALPEVVGGSADLTPSNLTRWPEAKDFQHGSYEGRYFRFGVREHAMAAFCNGVSAYGLLVPFCATFLNFISYALGAVRLSALSHHQVLYIMTHDSIGLGEDGPTHQPIETLASLRATPNIRVYRPADGLEVAGAYAAAALHRKGPTVLVLSRQNTPQLAGSCAFKTAERGGYVLNEFAATNAQAKKLVLVATGTELALAVEAAQRLSQGPQGVSVSVVSMPCCEIFDAQPLEYQKEVFPAGVPVISVEALSTHPWARYAHASVGMTTFGASAPAPLLYKEFGITVDGVIEKAHKVLAHYATVAPEHKVVRF